MYLARELRQGLQRHPMVGSLPVAVEQTARPQGHGYVRARVDGENPFLHAGAEICGHEFHYSRLDPERPELQTCLELMRGVGLGAGRDGLRRAGAVATYTHLHALGEPDWAPALVRAAAGEA